MSTVATTESDVDRKAFETLRASLAFSRHSLWRSNPADGPTTYFVSRWGLVREMRSLKEVADFATQVGAEH